MIAAAAPSAAATLDDRLALACGLAVAAGAIHAMAAVEHRSEAPLLAVCFAALALAQVAWATVVVRSPGPRRLAAGALGCLVVVVLWGISRTVGLPGGEGVEPVGGLDAICSADELALTLFVLVALRAPPAAAARAPWRRLLVGAGLGLILASSLLVAGGAQTH